MFLSNGGPIPSRFATTVETSRDTETTLSLTRLVALSAICIARLSSNPVSRRDVMRQGTAARRPATLPNTLAGLR